MTEAEWQSCQDPEKMLEYLRGRASDRKLWLFGVACCRRIQHLLLAPHEPWEGIRVAELFADDRATREELRAAAQCDGDRAMAVVRELVRDTAYFAHRAAALEESGTSGQVAEAAEQQAQAILLRDLIGNPFKPLTISPTVLATQGGVVVRMATAIYNDHRWEDLPLLGDTLEEAGMTDQAVLDHCRGPGPHSRGCHVVDLILAKS